MFFVAVVPDSVAVVICRSSASGRVGTYLTTEFVFLRTCLTSSLFLLIADSSSLVVTFAFFTTQFYFPASVHASPGHRCRPSPPSGYYCLQD